MSSTALLERDTVTNFYHGSNACSQIQIVCTESMLTGKHNLYLKYRTILE